VNTLLARRLLSVSFVLTSFIGLTSIVGCGGGDTKPGVWIEDGTPAAEKQPDFVTDLARDFFRDWLTNHGETEIVADKRGVGIEGNGTRLLAFHYGTEESGNGFSVETEFRITLPDGREIVEFVAGSGDTQEAAVQMTFLNFTMSTFHVVYSCFMNMDDPHMTHERITAGGKEWILTTGGMFALGGDDLPDFSSVSKACRDQLSDLTLSDEAHWLKVVYGRHETEVLAASATLDNEGHELLTSRLDRLPWPPTENFYMAKQFIVLRPAIASTENDSSGE